VVGEGMKGAGKKRKGGGEGEEGGAVLVRWRVE